MTATNVLKKAKTLRKNLTDAEKKLWYCLRGKRFDGVKFKRQKPIGSYIVDFVAVNEKLVVELDGGQHQERVAYDQERTRYFERCGYRVLRFWNNECLTETEAVLERIQSALSPCPSPTSERGELSNSTNCAPSVACFSPTSGRREIHVQVREESDNKITP